jgi:hypothetical protein
MSKRTSRKLTPAQRRVQDALRVVVEWQREILEAAGLTWEARRDETFWGLCSYVEDVGDGDLPPRWFELAEEALLLAPSKDVRERVETRWQKARLIGFARQREQRNAGKGRGNQRKDAVAERDAKLRDLAATIRAKSPGIPERTIAARLWRHPDKPGGTLSEERIRAIIKPA